MEEPMDISGEDGDIFDEERIPQRFLVNQKSLNTTICSSSPSRGEGKFFVRSKSMDEVRKVLGQRILKPKTDQDYPNMSSSIRKLTKRHSIDGPLPKKPKIDYNENSVPSSKKKPSLFKNTKDKFIMWGIIILLCFLGRLYLSYVYPCEIFVDVPNMEKNFDNFVFGQHIAKDVVLSTISEHWNISVNTNHSGIKPLVLSFHGWTGVGKNYITKIILHSFHMRRIRTLLIPLHFPNSKDKSYETLVPKWIRSNITQCRINVFVFDEMDKAPVSLLKGLKTSLRSLKSKEFYNTWVIFIFLSNSKGSHINNQLFSKISAGRVREELQIEDFIPVLFQNAEDEWFDSFKNEQLIDRFIPFLPLTKAHVKQCIKTDISSKKRKSSPELINKVSDEISYFSPPGSQEEYSLTGCKRVSDKVDLHITL